jgi:DNA-binding beta-propeller fold protein YncE
MEMSWRTWFSLILATFIAFGVRDAREAMIAKASAATKSLEGAQAAAQTREVPKFEVDPAWPKIPNNWVLGLVSGVNVDSHDNVWIIHRPNTVPVDQRAMAAPALLEFGPSGNFIQAWGGPGEGYEWVDTPHGISVDNKGFVWVGGSAVGIDCQILKFTNTGKFVMQIGHKGQSKGNTDTNNLNGPADVTVYPKTNEVFVADGYGNRRIIVFDADTGAFKRMWSAFGNPPTDPPPPSQVPKTGPGSWESTAFDGPGAQQFDLVHAVRISNDGLVYVSDRRNKRVQVFTVDGKYVTQVFLSREKFPPSTLPGAYRGKPIKDLEDGLTRAGMTASRTAFSPDPQQKYLYVIDRIRQQIAILDRKSLEILGYVGDGIGEAPGQFYILHDIATDSKGNLYTAEVNDDGNRRAQKFVFKGMTTASTK